MQFDSVLISHLQSSKVPTELLTHKVLRIQELHDVYMMFKLTGIHPQFSTGNLQLELSWY